MIIMSYLEKIGNLIKENRIQSGLSQEQLAKMSNIQRSQLSKIEKGTIKGVNLHTIESIFNTFNLSLFPAQIKPGQQDIKPFVKWAGGKTQLLNTLLKYVPKEFNRYYEPFIGGGALLFKIKPNNFWINDFNKELVSAFLCFKDNDKFVKMIEQIEKHQQNHSEEYFYKIRDLDREKSFANASIDQIASRFIYLNKSCFNGLYRVNKNGFFNVPSAKKTNVVCYDPNNFKSIRNYFQNSECKITSLDFSKAVETAQSGDFVYFDPPYDNYEEQKNFTSYNKDGFSKQDQIRLADLFKELDKKNVKVMLSNHDTKFIRELYKGFEIIEVEARRNINSNALKRGNVKEVIIRNYID
ncbi:DNA methyltransferase [Mycoplasma yeatsii GM274B]|nr:DNA methyltransferase [Mycoplasma yeatsii GM274B]